MIVTQAWIALGSNLGQRRETLDQALRDLDHTPGIKLIAASRYWETTPIGGPPGQGAFLNGAAELATSLTPYELLDVLLETERKAGRVRVARWGERILDLDLLLFGDGHQIQDRQGRLIVPHPRMGFRRFVLGPLAEIAPSAIDPITEQTIQALLERLDQRPRLLGWFDEFDGPDRFHMENVLNDPIANPADTWRIISLSNQTQASAPNLVVWNNKTHDYVHKNSSGQTWRTVPRVWVEGQNWELARSEIVAACRAGDSLGSILFLEPDITPQTYINTNVQK